MSEYALPCIICGTPLRNALRGDVDNQPLDGVCCLTHGNYGSTVFDSFNGEFLEFNICDPCLVGAGAEGRVWIARERRPVTTEGILIGNERVPYLPVPWREGMAPDRDILDLDSDELDNPPSTIHLTIPIEMVKQMLTEE